ncbi:hypothetical protein [Selenihalanaerobacter shriftii]|uniref:Uncharacterized protein n=1 Tax=Selenihalanaerobacter shriftii TaxID=142842 RepID=A0A1T4NWA1_9FIRM|nr:hypothetical protein [Selenihalanaerobacter shriftii]SJZ83519.1 hypothetical protein SAMN02745118_01955 [Selenihalanaerobacter shriftii]
MNKHKFLTVGIILLLIGLVVLINTEILNNNQINQFLTEILSVKIMAIILIVACLLLIIYLIIKFNIWSKILTFYKLDLNGKFILRLNLMSNSYTEITNYQKFKDKLAQFQTKYDFLKYDIDYTSSSISIELKTPQKLNIKNGEDFLKQFVNELNKMISLLSTEQIFIDLNITGEVNNLKENISFIITNQDNKVGINKNKYPNGIMSKLTHING